MENVKDVSAGGNHSFILKTDNTLWATGDNFLGQLGDGTNTDRKSPVKIMENVKDVSAGAAHSLILTKSNNLTTRNIFTTGNNTLWATGFNFYGRLGDGTDIERNSPVKIMENVKDIWEAEPTALSLQLIIPFGQPEIILRPIR